MSDKNEGAGDGQGEELKPGDEGYVDPTGNKGGEEGGDGAGDGAGGGEGEGEKETPQEKLARLKGMTLRAAKDAGISEDEIFTPKKEKSSKKSDELDLGQEAYLVAKGIEEADEIALVKQVMADTGKSMKDVLASKYFQAELKEMRADRETAAALPKSGKRSGQSAVNTVEYWLSKGGLPEDTPENTQLRRDIVNARAKKEKSGNMFTSNPVVGNPQ